MTKWIAVLISLTSLGLTAQQRQADESRSVTVDCNGGGAINRVLNNLKPGDVVLVQGRCLENVVMQSERQRITIDGQGTATVKPPDARQPAIQVLGREITIRGFTTNGGFSGIAINRGGTAIIDHNMIENALEMGLEVSQNSFGRIVNNTIRHSGVDGIVVLGSASAHIGVLRRTIRFRVRIQSWKMAAMASECCAPPPPASLETVSPAIVAADFQSSRPKTRRLRASSAATCPRNRADGHQPVVHNSGGIDAWDRAVG